MLLSVPKDIKLEYKIEFLEFKLPPYIKDKEIKYIEIIPSIGSYSMSIVYNNNLEITPNQSKDWISIDLGINNLCSITSNKFVPVLLNGKPSFTNPSNTALKIISCKLIDAIELKSVSFKVALTFILYKMNVCKIFTKNAVIIGIVKGIVGIVTPTNIITGTQIIFITAITGPIASLNQKNHPATNLLFCLGLKDLADGLNSFQCFLRI